MLLSIKIYAPATLDMIVGAGKAVVVGKAWSLSLGNNPAWFGKPLSLRISFDWRVRGIYHPGLTLPILRRYSARLMRSWVIWGL